MSILKLKPQGKDYIWGGRRLIDEYGKEFEGDKLAETWELSCHFDGPSTIVNGTFAGKTLQEYIISRGWHILGTKARGKDQFPLLIKFIDAKEDLSIQVHPTDEYALEHEGQYGKTEMWYVIDCEEDSYIYYGFSKEITKEEFEQRIHNKTLLEVLNKVAVKKGDVFFIEPGTLHAICGGSLIVEIQQNSNVTYRVYDYERTGKDGRKRELHIDKALDVTKCVPSKRNYEFGSHLAVCPYFTVDEVEAAGRFSGSVGEDSFVSILVLQGEGNIFADRDKVNIKKGDSIFMEAGTGNYCVEGNVKMLVTTL